ncbi:ROK family protein [Actinoallomurus sp. CA-142502]|uniref:ROK family protein n=1 Tax=Actinoallomurus sp. CA-142502 TaxID=3239885 RepID=UPI003D9428FB
MTDMALALAIDFGKTRLKLALVDRSGQITAQSEYSSAGFKSSEEVTEAIVTGVNEHLRPPPESVVGIGVGATGSIDTTSGVIKTSGSLAYLRDYNICAQLESALGWHANAVNDVSAAALGEAVYGYYGSESRLAFLSIATGVGMALVRRRKVDFGATGSLGLISGIKLPPDGRAVKELLGGKAISNDLREDSAILEDAASTTALLIAFIAGLCDPDVIVLGGGVWEGNALLRNRALEKIPEFIGSSSTGLQLPIVKSSDLGDGAGLKGAAHLAFSQSAER